MEDLQRLRKEKKMSQAELGALLRVGLEERNISLRQTYAEKKISLFESGAAQPSPIELTVLAGIFSVAPKELEAGFSKAPIGGPDFFRRMTAPGGPPVLIAALYGGRQRIATDEDFNQALLDGLRANVSLAMYCPYPDPRVLKAPAAEEILMQLSHDYSDARLHALNRYKALREQLPDHLKTRIALYEPNIPDGVTVPLFLAPFDHRRTLVIQTGDGNILKPSLYTWIESSGSEAFFRAGTFATTNFEQQYAAWEAYFGAPLEHWKREQTFTRFEANNLQSAWKTWGPWLEQ